MIANILSVIVGFGSGMVISGAVFAFITVVGVVPRFAQKTQTQAHVRAYETAVTLGGIFGTIAGFVQLVVPLGGVILAFLSLCIGIFFGSLAMSLAETLDVIPILTRRGRVSRGLFFFVIAMALGKLVGSLLYFLVTGFYDASNM
ncbi:MAG: stage V sporulation protein AB [Defluviitaleaceae bacterium]|nr:stage V sporulation protein AB [Defluviitaleaceae bacterium]MCL2199289.1 stage V sporulation protein AB [Defluviitaleaceae bacterium]